MTYSSLQQMEAKAVRRLREGRTDFGGYGRERNEAHRLWYALQRGEIDRHAFKDAVDHLFHDGHRQAIVHRHHNHND